MATHARQTFAAKSLAWGLDIAVWLGLFWTIGILVDALMYALQYRSTIGSESPFVMCATGFASVSGLALLVLGAMLSGIAGASIRERLQRRSGQRRFPSKA